MFPLTNSAEDSAAEIRKLGGLKPLVALLSNKNPDVQKYAAMAVGNCADDGLPTLHVFDTRLMSITEESRLQVREFNGISALISLLSSKQADVQQKAAWALGRFCQHDDDIKTALLQNNGIRSLVSLLNARSSEVLEMVMTVLATCADRAECAMEIRKHGGLRSLVSLLGAKDEYIQQVAALAVGSCADKGDNAAEVTSPFYRLVSYAVLTLYCRFVT